MEEKPRELDMNELNEVAGGVGAPRDGYKCPYCSFICQIPRELIPHIKACHPEELE